MEKKYAVITGATSGIGKSFAQQLAKKGFNLLITGRRSELLIETSKKIKKKYNVDVQVSVGDLSDKSYVIDLCEDIADLGKIEYLINNAGYGNRDSFFEGIFEEQQLMLDVHIYALTKLVHVVGNIMKNQRFGNIINVSSLASFFPIPKGEFYCSTKSFINSFSESIFVDLRDYNINVQSLCPGFTYTDFHRKLSIADESRKNNFLIRWMKADDVVNISLKMIMKKDVVIVVPGLFNKMLYLFSRIVPKQLYYKKANGGVKIPGKK